MTKAEIISSMTAMERKFRIMAMKHDHGATRAANEGKELLEMSRISRADSFHAVADEIGKLLKEAK